MRFTLVICLLAAIIYSGCAYQGTVVRKEFHPLPFYESLGLEGIYRFDLRDRSGQIHSQMVNATVFANFEVGDYFDDLQPAPPHSYRSGAPIPSVMAWPARQPLQYYETPYRRLRDIH